MPTWMNAGVAMAHIPYSGPLWFGLVLAGSAATFWALWTLLTATGVLPMSWNRFGALGVVGDTVLIIGFGAFGIWALSYGLFLWKTNPTRKEL